MTKRYKLSEDVIIKSTNSEDTIIYSICSDNILKINQTAKYIVEKIQQQSESSLEDLSHFMKEDFDSPDESEILPFIEKLIKLKVIEEL